MYLFCVFLYGRDNVNRQCHEKLTVGQGYIDNGLLNTSVYNKVLFCNICNSAKCVLDNSVNAFLFGITHMGHLCAGLDCHVDV